MAAAAAAVAEFAWYRIGLPGTRSASPRSVRVVSALPTAPADRSRALAISPGLQGPGWSVRYSATWRRSWPLPSRPFGAAGAAGAVIGITSVKARRIRGRHWRAHAFRHYPDFRFGRVIFPAISGYATTLSRYFRRSQRLSAEFGEFSRQFDAIPNGQPRARIPSATAPFPARRPPIARTFPAPPPTPRARRACLAVRPRGPPAGQGWGRGRSGAGARARTGVHIHRKGHHRKIKIQRDHQPGAPITIVLRAVRVYKSGSPQEGLFGALPAHFPHPGGSGVGRYTEWNTD